jgi:glycosyltransferase involved in cell wall biosynthesis
VEILIVSRCLPWPLHYGDRLILHHQVAELTARGHQCDIVALARPDEDRDAVARSPEICRELELVTEQGRSPARYLARLARPFPHRAAQTWNPAMWRAVERRMSSRRYDIVHVFGGIQVYELRDLVARLPAIIVPYESYSLLLERALDDAGGVIERLRLRAMLETAKRYERVIYRGYDRVVVLTGRDREALQRLSPGLRIVVIPNGVRACALPHRRTEPPEAVFVGNFEYTPNVRAARVLVLDVLPRLRRHRPDWRAVLVGANPPPSISTLASDSVEVTGWVPDIAPYLARAVCLIAPITQGAGMKNKILEAMSAGLPVVTTPMGCDGLSVVDGEHLLLGANASELAEAAIRLMEDDALAERIGTAAQRLVAMHHAWSRIAARYEELYAEAIADRSG